MELKLAYVAMGVLLSAVPILEGQDVVPLWPADAGNIGRGETIDFFQNDPADRWIGRISVPTLTVLLPQPDRSSGIAVVVCPGGGYSRELYDREGLEVARWLNQIGIAGIVLKYRLPTGRYTEGQDAMPLEDALRAIRLVRSRAAAWKLNPARIGIMGFSAGGHVASSAATLFAGPHPEASDPVERLSSRPDFAALIYPQISMQPDIGAKENRLLGPAPSAELMHKYSAELNITPQTPPTFLVLCRDDPYLSPEHVLRYCTAAAKAGVNTELHLYQQGGHGFGVRGINEPGAGSWPHRFEAWIKALFPVSSAK